MRGTYWFAHGWKTDSCIGWQFIVYELLRNVVNQASLDSLASLASLDSRPLDHTDQASATAKSQSVSFTKMSP